MATINTNVAATRAANALDVNERDMNKAMERLSTGKRINTAQDDAAGLAIASKMTSQINSLDQAVRNAGDAISMVQSADGAMIEITNMVQRMRELAIQSISDTNTASDRQALNLEFQALAAEISRIGGNTQWNGGNLLDGTNGTNGMSTFHIGANANQVITATFPTIGSVEGDFTPSTTTAAADAVTAVTAVPGVVHFDLTDAQVAAMSADFVVSDGTNSATIAASELGTGNTHDTLAKLAAAIDDSGLDFTVTADADGLVFTYAGAVGATNPTATGLTASIETAGTTAVAPVAAKAQVTTLTLSSTFGTIQNGDVLTYTVDGRAASAVLTSVQNSDLTYTMQSISATNVSGETSGEVKLTMTNANTLVLTGTNTGATAGFVIDNVQVTRGIAADVGKTDISSFTTATDALSVLDKAVAEVNMKRAELGAVANRLEYASDNMANVSMNARASRSRVEDADYASETTELARTQIIQQAGTAMLAQANQSQQSVLKLLQ